MDEIITQNVGKLLAGEEIEFHQPEFDDSEFTPVTKFNMCHIVAAVLINEKEEVLLIQEAKLSCRGSWYLPAGRLEQGETLVDGVKREVLEESGFIFEPETMICVECGGGTWFRYSFTGPVTGGKLKTTAEADSESLQARWVPWNEISSRRIELRCADIINLIELTLSHKKNESSHNSILPCIVPRKQNTHRCVVVRVCDKSIKVLVHKESSPHFPSSWISPRAPSLKLSLINILADAFGPYTQDPIMCGILTIEHSGLPERTNDGVCFTSLTDLSHESKESRVRVKNSKYEWMDIQNENISKQLQDRIKNCLFLDNHRENNARTN